MPRNNSLAEFERVTERIGNLRAELRLLQQQQTNLRRQLEHSTSDDSEQQAPLFNGFPRAIVETRDAVREVGDHATAGSIAERLGQNLPTTRNRLHRALKAGAIRRVGYGKYQAVETGE
ncbi:MAG: hypothetical protein IH851_12325 [Armatimonadetes bacterium]|nr:hypothetical protein [Armatimonadota bacterium]